MRLGQLALISSIAVALTLPAVAATRAHRSAASAHKTTAKHTAKSKPVGQRGIDDERATQIQAALIKSGYLSGTPSGHWDAASIAAMTKVQADHGWQTKLVPDSRALIKLGLGPASASSQPPGSASGESLASPSASLAAAQADALAGSRSVGP
jgi:peptidoglycan hydrolase-like protein with peptidoglycan-binding domain